MIRDFLPEEESSSKQLTAAGLARDFGLQSSVARRCLPALLSLVSAPHHAAAAEAAFGEGLGEVRIASCRSSLAAAARRLDLSPCSAAPFLWALKLYYAAVVRAVTEGGYRGSGDLLERDFPAELVALIRAATDAISAELNPVLTPDALQSEKGDFAARDIFQQLYQALIPRPVRQVLGEYYTPEWLVEHVLDQLEMGSSPAVRLFDPACGSGAFLLGAIRRLRWLPQREEIPKRVQGVDLNPLAVLSARANYLLALGDLWPAATLPVVPVDYGDSILGGCFDASRGQEKFDVIVGNPPWIAWDNLPAEYREATKPLWKRYGLFSLPAAAARHGGGKKDLSMLMLYAVADRCLKSGGRLALLMTQTIFQTHGAGDGFRRFRLGDEGEALRVLRVDDFVDVRPFGDAANWTSVIYLEKGKPTQYPVTYIRWKAPTKTATADRGLPNAARRSRCGEPVLYQARPIDPRRPTAPWLLQPAAAGADGFPRIGPSEYPAYLGANSGGLNGVFWLEVLEETAEGVRVRNVVEKGKRALKGLEITLEPDLLYPLLCWGELRRYAAVPRRAILLVQDPQRRRGIDPSHLEAAFPRTYAYLRQFETSLRERAAYRRYQSRGPFYSMYNVGPYTLAPIKVVWRRMDRRMTAAVVACREHPWLGPKPVVPQETCVFIPCATAEEAHYLCALLNSAPLTTLVQSMSVRGGKGFGTPKVLDYLSLRQFDPQDERHGLLAALSRQAHRLQEKEQSVEEVQQRIDALATELQRGEGFGTE